MDKIPNHSSEPVLLLAQERIIFPSVTSNQKSIHYEHQVGTWACTMLAKHFGPHAYLITPEMFIHGTNKKPDFIIEKYCEQERDKSKFNVGYELKKQGGEVFDKAVSQVSNAISQLHDIQYGSIEMFVIVQRGRQIAFFDYFSYHSLLEEEGINHFKGCVPLTYLHEKLVFQNEKIKSEMENLINDLPGDVEYLVEENEKRKSSSSLTQADEIVTPCVFDLEIHSFEINFLFHYMANFHSREIKEQ